MTIEQSIARGISRLNIQISDSAVGSLAGFVSVLHHWNRIYNLTAIRHPEDMVVRHILDSLAILPWLQGKNLLDVGSGAGLPGIPLAISRPQWHFCLVESSGKRTRFMNHAIAMLQLSNVTVVRCRIEHYDPETLFDSVVCRAFGSLTQWLQVAGRFCAPGGRLLAMKGANVEGELQELPSGYRLIGVYPIQVPDLQAQRRLIHLAPLETGDSVMTHRAEETID